MSALAPRAAQVFGGVAGERASLKPPRGAVAVAPLACGKMAREKLARRVVATQPSAPPPQKREISEGSGVTKAPVFPAPPPRHHKEQMEAASACKDGARILAAKRRWPEAPSSEEAAKRRKTSPSTPAPQAAHQRTGPAKPQPLTDQQRAAPTTAQRPMSKLIEKAQEAMQKRRIEEIARAREKFRRELLEMEKAAMPDETIYPEDLEALGLTTFQYAVTRTRKQVLRRAG